jgi:hypothetical protein
MENFMVVDKATKKQVGKGFPNKEEAKAKRDELQGKTENGMPKPEVRQDQNLWAFKVTRGKDHPKLKDVIH